MSDKKYRLVQKSGAPVDADIDATAREIRIALLEADVALPVVKDLVARVLSFDYIGALVASLIHEIVRLGGADGDDELLGDLAVVHAGGDPAGDRAHRFRRMLRQADSRTQVPR